VDKLQVLGCCNLRHIYL